MIRPSNKDIDRVMRKALDSLNDGMDNMPVVVDISARDLCTLLSAAKYCRKHTQELTNNDDRRNHERIQ